MMPNTEPITDDRFGPNGSVMDRMTPQMRDEYEKAAHVSARSLRGVLVQAVLLAPLFFGLQAVSRSDWYATPGWAWGALMAAIGLSLAILFLGVAFRARRRWFEKVAPCLPLGVVFALVIDAFLQYRAAADAGLPLP